MLNIWKTKDSAGMSDLDKLIYQSHLIGAEESLVLWGGGNTSIKTVEKDFFGVPQRVLRIKGSGSDLKSVEAKDFPAINLDKVLPLLDREHMSDEAMVDFLDHCLMESSAPRPSIETLLHAFLPFKSVVHSHADAILSLTNTTKHNTIIRKALGDSIIVLPYTRPGFKLYNDSAVCLGKQNNANGLILVNHGLVTWGNTPEEAYSKHIDIVTQAEKFVTKTRKHKTQTETQERFYNQKLVSAVTPFIRGLISKNDKSVLTFHSDEKIIEFANMENIESLIKIGAATPDHLMHSKRLPLFVKNTDKYDSEELVLEIKNAVDKYTNNYTKWFSKHTDHAHPMLDPFPRVIIIRGLGMWTAGKDKRSAHIAQDIYSHTIDIVINADSIDSYTSLSDQQSYDAEYWPLELYKRSLAPANKELSRQVALVTGAASGIGKAITHRFLQEGAHVIATDVDYESLKILSDELCKSYGNDRILPVKMDVTNESEVLAAFENIKLNFGGLDILVSNAGVAYTGLINNLDSKDWEKSFAVNATGHFLVSKHSINTMRHQNIGGSIIFIATKNVTSPGAALGAYSAAKAAEAQLARVIAIENGEYGIRSNIINPDAIFEDSNLWSSEVKEERAKAHGVLAEEIQDFYRKRTLLKQAVTAEDVAETALFLASDRSMKTTGAMIPVDAGIRDAFVR